MKKVLFLLVALSMLSSCMYSVTRLPNGCKYYHVKKRSDRYRHYTIY